MQISKQNKCSHPVLEGENTWVVLGGWPQGQKTVYSLLYLQVHTESLT